MIRVRHIFISPGHNFVGHHGQPPGEHPAIEVDSVECVPHLGLRGDRYFDFKEDYKAQITFFSWETLEQMKRELGVGQLSPSATRRNVITEGVDLPALIGREFEIQGIRFFGMEECKPCHWMNQAIHSGAEEWMRGRGGLRAKILKGGILRQSPSPATSFSAVILAGGQSSRMGQDKASLPYKDGSLLSHQMDKISALGPLELFVSARPKTDYNQPGATLLFDSYMDAGPLAGIERALEAAATPVVLVLAVDMPNITTELLHGLIAECRPPKGVVPRIGGSLEPLAAIYPKTAHPLAVEMLRKGNCGVKGFARRCSNEGLLDICDYEASYSRFFGSWNCPSDIVK